MSEAALHRAMRALAEVSDQLVLVGGTAQRLFPLHPLGRDPGFDLLSTEDVDLAAPLAIRVPADTDLLERLREAGFEDKVSGADRAKWTYPLRDGDGAYLEFIAPRVGSGIKRNEQPDLVLRFSGIHAEKLPNVHALLHRPWEVELESADTRIRFQVVNPITYIAQKLITMQGRPPLKRGKDLLYVFDTLAIFGDHLDILGEQENVLLPALNKKQRRSAAKRSRNIAPKTAPPPAPPRQSQANNARARRRPRRSRPPAPAFYRAYCQVSLAKPQTTSVDSENRSAMRRYRAGTKSDAYPHPVPHRASGCRSRSTRRPTDNARLAAGLLSKMRTKLSLVVAVRRQILSRLGMNASRSPPPAPSHAPRPATSTHKHVSKSQAPETHIRS